MSMFFCTDENKILIVASKCCLHASSGTQIIIVLAQDQTHLHQTRGKSWYPRARWSAIIIIRFLFFIFAGYRVPPLPVALGPFYRLYHVLRIADPHRLQTLRQTHGHVITADVQIVYLPWGNERDLRSLDVTNCCNYERTTGQGVSP